MKKRLFLIYFSLLEFKILISFNRFDLFFIFELLHKFKSGRLFTNDRFLVFQSFRQEYYVATLAYKFRSQAGI